MMDDDTKRRITERIAFLERAQNQMLGALGELQALLQPEPPPRPAPPAPPAPETPREG